MVNVPVLIPETPFPIIAIFVSTPVWPATKDCHCVDPPVPVIAPEELFTSIASEPAATERFPLTVLSPANVCVPVVIIPPFVPSAGVRLITPDVRVAPFAFELPPIAPNEIEAGVIHDNVPLPVVDKTWPLAPWALG